MCTSSDPGKREGYKHPLALKMVTDGKFSIELLGVMSQLRGQTGKNTHDAEYIRHGSVIVPIILGMWPA